MGMFLYMNVIVLYRFTHHEFVPLCNTKRTTLTNTHPINNQTQNIHICFFYVFVCVYASAYTCSGMGVENGVGWVGWGEFLHSVVVLVLHNGRIIRRCVTTRQAISPLETHVYDHA